MNLGVLASHEGSTLQAVLDACASGAIRGRVTVVISNNSEARALRRAAAAGISVCHISAHTHPEPEDWDRAVCEALDAAAVDVVLLAGFMKRLGAHTLIRYRGRTLNTHPALLPKYGGPGMYGMHVHRAVLAAGDHITGASVHAVTAAYDEGPVVAQRAVSVEPGDTPETLATRVQAAERELVVDVLSGLAGAYLVPPPAARDVLMYRPHNER